MKEWWQVLLVGGWMVIIAIQPWGAVIGAGMAGIGCLLLVGGQIRCRRDIREKRQEQTRRFLGLWSRQRHDWMNHIQILLAYTSLNQMDRVSTHLQTLAAELAAEREVTRVKCPSLALFLSTLRVTWLEWKTEVVVSSKLSDLDGLGAERVERVLHQVMNWMTPFASTDGEPEELWIFLDKTAEGVSIRLEGEAQTWTQIPESAWDQLNQRLQEWNARLTPEEQGLIVILPAEEK